MISRLRFDVNVGHDGWVFRDYRNSKETWTYCWNSVSNYCRLLAGCTRRARELGHPEGCRRLGLALALFQAGYQGIIVNRLWGQLLSPEGGFLCLQRRVLLVSRPPRRHTRLCFGGIMLPPSKLHKISCLELFIFITTFIVNSEGTCQAKYEEQKIRKQ